MDYLEFMNELGHNYKSTYIVSRECSATDYLFCGQWVLCQNCKKVVDSLTSLTSLTHFSLTFGNKKIKQSSSIIFESFFCTLQVVFIFDIPPSAYVVFSDHYQSFMSVCENCVVHWCQIFLPAHDCFSLILLKLWNR